MEAIAARILQSRLSCPINFLPVRRRPSKAGTTTSFLPLPSPRSLKSRACLLVLNQFTGDNGNLPTCLPLCFKASPCLLPKYSRFLLISLLLASPLRYEVNHSPFLVVTISHLSATFSFLNFSYIFSNIKQPTFLSCCHTRLYIPSLTLSSIQLLREALSSNTPGPTLPTLRESKLRLFDCATVLA